MMWINCYFNLNSRFNGYYFIDLTEHEGIVDYCSVGKCGFYYYLLGRDLMTHEAPEAAAIQSTHLWNRSRQHRHTNTMFDAQNLPTVAFSLKLTSDPDVWYSSAAHDAEEGRINVLQM